MLNRRSFFGGLAGLFGLGAAAKAAQSGEVRLGAKKIITTIKIPNELLAHRQYLLVRLEEHNNNQDQIDRIRNEFYKRYVGPSSAFMLPKK